jgi:hypothetical protein
MPRHATRDPGLSVISSDLYDHGFGMCGVDARQLSCPGRKYRLPSRRAVRIVRQSACRQTGSRTMPQIEISVDTLALLKRHAEPLVDTYDTIIGKFGRAFEASNGHADKELSPIVVQTPISAKVYSNDSPPDLTFTKVRSAKLDGTPLANGTNWANILRWAVRKAKNHAKTEDDLRRLIIVNFVAGKKEDEGFKYLPEVNLSVQGQDTNAAWRGINHIAQQLKLPIDVVFVWRHKEKAAFPGETGRLVVG